LTSTGSSPERALPRPAELARFAERVAREAGAIVRDRLSAPGAIRAKSASIDLVTDSDKAADAWITRRIRETYPTHRVLSEEGAEAKPDPRTSQVENLICWVVDPLDGTMNYAHRFPHFAVSIAAVVPAERTILAGAVYDPMRDELFVASRRGGATLNRRPVKVSAADRLDRSLLATGFPYDRREHADFYLSFWRELMVRSQDVRRGGAAALDLAWVACGRLDAFWEWNLHPWDVAAGTLIVREAGGRVTDFAGNDLFLETQQTLASNGRVHDEIARVVGSLANGRRRAPRSVPTAKRSSTARLKQRHRR